MDALPNNFVDHLSKICMTLFDQWSIDIKSTVTLKFCKVTSGGWAEIKNVKKMQTFGFSISGLPPDGTF